MTIEHTGLKDCKFCTGRKVNCLEVLMGRMRLYPLNEQLQSNLEGLLVAANKLRELYGKSLIISSGYRPGEYNVKAGGSKQSSHISCQAIDFADKNKELKEWIKKDPSILEKCDLYAEDFDSTPVWLHIQTRKTASGKRIFKP